jgi:hypothetical protein
MPRGPGGSVSPSQRPLKRAEHREREFQKRISQLSIDHDRRERGLQRQIARLILEKVNLQAEVEALRGRNQELLEENGGLARLAREPGIPDEFPASHGDRAARISGSQGQDVPTTDPESFVDGVNL